MYHRPVMLQQCLEALAIKPEGTYVDVTFGGGGHSLAILEQIKGGRLIAFDQDKDAEAEASKINHSSFTFCKANFRYMKQYLKLNGVTRVDGILADLGISSHQIDSPQRGFSTRFDGPLDMRMDQSSKTTAAKIINEFPEAELHKIFGMYGELKNAKTVAKEIVAQRTVKPFTNTTELKSALQKLAPRGKENKYFAQVFQALRLVVNEELRALEDFLHQSAEVMATEGRLVVMSYHSLEDRMVKNFINTGKVFGELEKDFYGNPVRPFEAVNRKVIEASEEEIEQNNRARSAKLRIAWRTVSE
ncbi:MAG TPA: 16S rRNA (cytosine(1402)-N(4))-methyltransferase RsmH [Cyclobacteriaceae bacterium]|nr:16S rRNA (cytosine(1402)-N(4))-methyltransferase RsmH [Cyclobacteriaceae bacterium]